MLPGGRAGDFIIVAAIALIVVGPKDLPKLLRQLGRFVGKMRAMADDFKTSFEDMARQSELDELRKEVEAMRAQNAPSVLTDIQSEMRSLDSDVRAHLLDAPKIDTPAVAASDVLTPHTVEPLPGEAAPSSSGEPQMDGQPPQGKPAEDKPIKPRRPRAAKVEAPVEKTAVDPVVVKRARSRKASS